MTDGRVGSMARLSDHEYERWSALGFCEADAREWRAAGFRRPYHARLWFLNGFDSACAENWVGYGFDVDEAIKWSDAGFTADEAVEWRDAGIEPDEARQWRAAGLRPVFDEVERDEGDDG